MEWISVASVFPEAADLLDDEWAAGLAEEHTHFCTICSDNWWCECLECVDSFHDGEPALCPIHEEGE